MTFKYLYFKWWQNERFLTIKSHPFYNHLMHEKLAFKTHDVLSIDLLKYLDQDERSGSFIFIACYPLL